MLQILIDDLGLFVKLFPIGRLGAGGVSLVCENVGGGLGEALIVISSVTIIVGW